MAAVKDKLKAFWEKLKSVLGKVSRKIWIFIGILIVAAVVIVVVLNSNKSYEVLFTGLTSEEATKIMDYLDEQGITDYVLEEGSTILVPANQEPVLKMRLLMEGYPDQGFSYSMYYDKVSALSTESERDTAYLITLQERMSAVVRCFENVQDAVVLISPGEDNTYVLDYNNSVAATASVMVTMKDGKLLTDQQVVAIRNLVAHAVQGLEIESVVIEDTFGNPYTVGVSDEDASDASALKMRLEEKYNNLIRTNIMQVLVPLYGEENVKVGVTCTVDIDRMEQSSHEVFLPEYAADGSTDGEGIIGSQIFDDYISEGDEDGVGGPVGTETNSDLQTYIEEEIAPDGTEREIGVSGQIDYNNPETDTHKIRVAGYIADCMVSVSINTRTAGAVDVEAMQVHVARAAGISDELAASKISIYPGQFYVEPEEENPLLPGEESPIELWMIIAAGGGLLLFIILLIIVLIIRAKRRKKKRLAEERALREMYAASYASVAAEPVDGADVMSLNSEKTMELRKDIRKFADDNPELAAQMIRTMLRGGDNNG